MYNIKIIISTDSNNNYLAIKDIIKLCMGLSL